MKVSFFLIFLLVITSSTISQSITGVNGLVRVPTAEMYEDGTFIIGGSYIPKKYLDYSNNNYNAVNGFINITLLPFLEVSFRYTRMLEKEDYDSHFADRTPSVRLQILKEKKKLPFIAVGMHDFITTLDSGQARHFHAAYVVGTKNLALKKINSNLALTIGYGYPVFASSNGELKGLLAGIAYRYEGLQWLEIMGEFDGDQINAGIKALLFKHLHLMVGLQGMEELTGNISYRIYLK